MFTIYRYALVLPALLFALALPASVTAHSHQADQEAATKALAAGEILPLRTVLDRIKTIYPGQIMNVDFERDDDVWMYKIRMLHDDGRLSKLKVDAKTGDILIMKTRSYRHKGRD